MFVLAIGAASDIHTVIEANSAVTFRAGLEGRGLNRQGSFQYALR